MYHFYPRRAVRCGRDRPDFWPLATTPLHIDDDYIFDGEKFAHEMSSRNDQWPMLVEPYKYWRWKAGRLISEPAMTTNVWPGVGTVPCVNKVDPPRNVGHDRTLLYCYVLLNQESLALKIGGTVQSAHR